MADKITPKRLNLKSIVPERPVVALGDAEYQLKAVEDFGLRDQAWMRTRMPRLEELSGKAQVGTLTVEEAEEVESLTDDFLGVITFMPSDFIRGLSTEHKTAIIDFFSDTTLKVLREKNPQMEVQSGGT